MAKFHDDEAKFHEAEATFHKAEARFHQMIESDLQQADREYLEHCYDMQEMDRKEAAWQEMQRRQQQLQPVGEKLQHVEDVPQPRQMMAHIDTKAAQQKQLQKRMLSELRRTVPVSQIDAEPKPTPVELRQHIGLRSSEIDQIQHQMRSSEIDQNQQQMRAYQNAALRHHISETDLLAAKNGLRKNVSTPVRQNMAFPYMHARW